MDKKMKVPYNYLPMQFANPEEIANLVIFLCSELNTYITGQNLIIDGGVSII
jgi:3-oxoacyl-[acyl-carrier protein] reductase